MSLLVTVKSVFTVCSFNLTLASFSLFIFIIICSSGNIISVSVSTTSLYASDLDPSRSVWCVCAAPWWSRRLFTLCFISQLQLKVVKKESPAPQNERAGFVTAELFFFQHVIMSCLMMSPNQTDQKQH